MGCQHYWLSLNTSYFIYLFFNQQIFFQNFKLWVGKDFLGFRGNLSVFTHLPYHLPSHQAGTQSGIQSTTDKMHVSWCTREEVMGYKEVGRPERHDGKAILPNRPGFCWCYYLKDGDLASMIHSPKVQMVRTVPGQGRNSESHLCLPYCCCHRVHPVRELCEKRRRAAHQALW